MRVPHPDIIAKLTRFIAAFILGGVIGSIVILYLYGHTMNDILRQNRQLTLDNIKLREDIALLEEDKSELSKRNQQKLIIRRVEIDVLEQPRLQMDELTEKEITERLRKDLKFLIQLPLDGVAETSEAIRHLVNGRKYEIQQQMYGLNLETLIISTTVTVKITVYKEDG